MPLYQPAHVPRSLPQLGFGSFEVFTTALGQLEVKEKGCNGSPGQSSLHLKLAGNDAPTCMNCYRLFVVLLSLLDRQSAPTFPMFPIESPHARVLFSPSPLATDKVVPPTIKVAGNVNSNFNVNSLEGYIEPCICGVLLFVPDGSLSAIMTTIRH